MFLRTTYIYIQGLAYVALNILRKQCKLVLSVKRITLYRNLNVHFSACRRRLHLSGTVSVNISSPGYPRVYPSSIICKWFITSENSVTSLITYLDFRLEDTSFCSSDFISFSFRETVEHECSMMSLPKTIQTAAQNYTVTFVTDGKNEFAGFLIQITSKGK